MKVLKPIETPQNVLLRTRTLDVNVVVIIRDEMSGEVVSMDPQIGVLTDEFLSISIQHDFKSGEEYSVNVLNINELNIWRGKIYITDKEDLQNYKLNDE